MTSPEPQPISKKIKNPGFLSPKLGDERKTSSNISLDEDTIDSKEAIKIVKYTWKELMNKKKEVGKKIYQEVIKKEVTLANLFADTNLQLQQGLFMDMLDQVIRWLDDEDTFRRKVQELGRGHMKNFKVERRHLRFFRSAFMKAIRLYIPWETSKKREEAWSWLWIEIINNMTTHDVITKNDDIVTEIGNMSRKDYKNFVEIINNTFLRVMDDNPLEFSESFYRELITSNKEIGSLFAFASQSEINVKIENKELMRQQGGKFMSMVKHTIEKLDSYKTFEQKMHKLSLQHRSYKLRPEHMEVFGNILISKIKNHPKNKDEWNENYDKIWAGFWALLVKLMSKQLKFNTRDTYNNNNNNDNNENKDDDNKKHNDTKGNGIKE